MAVIVGNLLREAVLEVGQVSSHILGWWQQLLQEDVDGLEDVIMSVVVPPFLQSIRASIQHMQQALLLTTQVA